MAKKEQRSTSKRIPLMIYFIVLGSCGWWLWQSDVFANWKDRILQYVDNRDIVTLEARYSPEQILESHREEILGNNKRTLQSTTLNYYPYLLLDVKYPEKSQTREGVLLWGLTDGEMVIHTDSWERTHGFRDCLECQAGRNDFKILYAIARHQGSILVDDLQKELHVEREVLATWLEGAKQKGLIIQKGNLLQLHFENPLLLVTPQTKIKHHLVSKPFSEGQKIARNYTHAQIVNITQAAFGNDFKIRSEQEIFLPVYKLEVLNPDGSLQFSEWNALTGQRIIPHYLSKN